MSATRKILVSVVMLGCILVAGGWYAIHLGYRSDDAIRVSGNIEAVEVNIAFKIPGHVEKRYVDEGDTVYQGKVIAEIDTADLEANVALAKAQLHLAEAALAEMVAGSRPDEIVAAKQAMEKAKANYAELKAGSRPEDIEAAKADYLAAQFDRDRLKTELDRDEALRKTSPGAITPEQYDLAMAAWRMADQKYIQLLKHYELAKIGPRQEDIDQAKAAFDQADAQYRLVKDGPRTEDIDEARARVEQAKASLQLARTNLSYATVVSPLTGVVLSKNAEPGEYVAPGTPVVTIADVENVWLRAYVDERDIGTGRVRWGQGADITTDAYPGKVYNGRISFISSEAEFTPKTVQTEKERVKLVYRIKIDVKNPDKQLKPGMPADAKLVGSGSP